MYIYTFVSLYLYVPDDGSLLPKCRDCTTCNDFELFIVIISYIFNVLWCDASVNLLYIYIYIAQSSQDDTNPMFLLY